MISQYNGASFTLASFFRGGYIQAKLLSVLIAHFPEILWEEV
jgi:hypothetical protein